MKYICHDQAGNEFGAATPYGSALIRVGQTEQKYHRHLRRHHHRHHHHFHHEIIFHNCHRQSLIRLGIIENSYKFSPSELSSQSLSSDQAWYDREGLHQRDERGAGSTPAEVSHIVIIITIKMTTNQDDQDDDNQDDQNDDKMTLIVAIMMIFKMTSPGSLMGR